MLKSRSRYSRPPSFVNVHFDFLDRLDLPFVHHGQPHLHAAAERRDVVPGDQEGRQVEKVDEHLVTVAVRK